MATVRSAILLALLSACSSDRPRAGRMCDVEQLEVTWPATIERGGVTTSERLAATLGPANVEPELFDSLANTLVRGRGAAPAILWSVPAFDTDPGGIAVMHPGRLTQGSVMRVAGVTEGGGWATMPAVGDSALVAIEAGDFIAHAATGTIAVLEARPLALRLDLTANDSAGATIRVRGDARFGARRERQRCASRDADP